MLIGLDESLYHQTPDPIGMTVTSDHRFFDRYWFSGVRPDGGLAFFAGMGRYPNMGMSDAFLNVVRGTRQFNVRCAALLTGGPDTSAELGGVVGPRRVVIREPFRRLTLALLPEAGPVAGELEYVSTAPPHLEAAHREVRDNRVLQQVQRYDQVGGWAGWRSTAPATTCGIGGATGTTPGVSGSTSGVSSHLRRTVVGAV